MNKLLTEDNEDKVY